MAELAKASRAGIQNVCMCVYPHALRNVRTYEVISQTTPDEHPSTTPPCQWTALITLSTPTKGPLVRRRLCDDVLFRSSCRFQHTLCAARGSEW